MSGAETVRWWSIALFPVAVVVLFAGITYLQPPASTMILQVQYFGVALVSLALVTAPYGRAAFGLLALRPASARWVLAGTAGSLVVSTAVGPLGLESDWMQELVDIIREPGQLPISLMVIGGLGPLTEELVFRGLLFAWLDRRWGPRVAVVGSAVPFAALHGEPVYIALALPMGLIFGALRWRSGSLLPSLVAHAVNNSLFVLLAKYFDVVF